MNAAKVRDFGAWKRSQGEVKGVQLLKRKGKREKEREREIETYRQRDVDARTRIDRGNLDSQSATPPNSHLPGVTVIKINHSRGSRLLLQEPSRLPVATVLSVVAVVIASARKRDGFRRCQNFCLDIRSLLAKQGVLELTFCQLFEHHSPNAGRAVQAKHSYRVSSQT